MSVKRPERRRQINKCPECGSSLLISDYEIGEVVCEECGFVIVETIADRGPEWRAFDAEQVAKRRRAGSPVTFSIHDKGLSTMIDQRNRDAYGRKLSSERRVQFNRMRKWQRRARVSDTMERNLSLALFHMSKTCSNIKLPKIVLETASITYRRALKKRLIRGRSIQGVASAAIYMACRKCGIARTLDEVASAANMKRKEVGRYYRFMVKSLSEFIPPPGPAHYISRFINHLELTNGAETIALRIIHAAKIARLTAGKGPLSIASASMYITSAIVSSWRTQREVAEATGVTEVTLRNRYKDLMENIDITVKL